MLDLVTSSAEVEFCLRTYFRINGIKSLPSQLFYGVPQGSSLGLPLIILYTNVNVNVRHTYWAPLNPVTEALHAVELTLFLWHTPEGVAEHSFLSCNHQSTCMPSYSLYVQLLWYPMYYPRGMKARVSPVQ